MSFVLCGRRLSVRSIGADSSGQFGLPLVTVGQQFLYRPWLASSTDKKALVRSQFYHIPLL